MITSKANLWSLGIAVGCILQFANIDALDHGSLSGNSWSLKMHKVGEGPVNIETEHAKFDENGLIEKKKESKCLNFDEQGNAIIKHCSKGGDNCDPCREHSFRHNHFDKHGHHEHHGHHGHDHHDHPGFFDRIFGHHGHDHHDHPGFFGRIFGHHGQQHSHPEHHGHDHHDHPGFFGR
ncbi:MAG: hypothetical protein LBO73_03835, partial [Holosporaceae bacterium]|nr:hypothetical protein [Holosporaceae bacterium]